MKDGQILFLSVFFDQKVLSAKMPSENILHTDGVTISGREEYRWQSVRKRTQPANWSLTGSTEFRQNRMRPRKIKHLGAAGIWNRMLGDHNTLYAEIGHVLNNTPADYKDLDECFFLNEVDSLALANTALNLDAAFEQFVICFRQKKYPGSSFRYWSRILVIFYPIFCAFLHFPHHKDTMPSSTMPRFLNSLVTFALSSNRSGNCS